MTPPQAERIFDLLGALFAFIAAVYWFRSAWPPLADDGERGRMGDNVAGAGGLLYLVVRSANLNRWAAFWAGLSALCAVAHYLAERAATP